jgi:hypothetical protein
MPPFLALKNDGKALEAGNQPFEVPKTERRRG